MTDNSGFVARLRDDASLFDRTELRTNMLVAADLVESLTSERDALRLENDRLLNHITRRIVRDSIARAEDDFGDASIQRAMIASRARGDEPTENKSRLVTEAEVREAATEIFTGSGIDEWYDHPQHWLDGMTPREAVATGNGKRVLALIDGIADGVFW